MIHAIDPASLEAFERLLARPDPRDLPHRSHVYRCEGEPNRCATRLPAILMGWLQWRYLAVEREEPIAPARRVPTRPSARAIHASFCVLRPTGTD